MKTRLLLGLAAGALVCASCSNDELENSLVNPVGQKVTITATIEGEEEQTRSTVTDEGKFDWAAGDKINVYTTNSVWKEFSYTNENKFEGTLDSEESTSTWAVYPKMTAAVSNEAYTVTLPATYSLGSNTNNTNAPMVAWFNEGETDFEFKHLGGVIRFTLTNVPTSATQFVLTADKKINGTFTLQESDANYIIVAEDEEENTTTLTFDAATEEMTFYVPLPTGTYNNMTFSLKDKDGNVLFTKTSSKAKTVNRRSLLIMNPIEATVSVSTEQELTKALATDGNIKLGADVTLDKTLTISNNVTIDLNGKTLTFNLAEKYKPGIANKANLTIKNSGNTGKIVSNELGINNYETLTVNCDIESVETAINNGYNGKVTIEGGSYKSTSTTSALICSNNFGNGTPSLTINAGRFESAFTNVSYNNASTGAVNGGTFICTGTNNSTNHNIYVGGENGNCNVTFNQSNCSFTSNGIEVFVGDMSGTGTKTNTVNNQTYTGNNTVLDITTQQ